MAKLLLFLVLGGAFLEDYCLAELTTARKPEPTRMASKESCATYRLDWIAGGPFNPYPLNEKSADAAICSGVENVDACLAAHKGDGTQRAYVPIHSQGSDGNCTFQTVAGVINYDRSMKKLPPDVSPEYLAAQNCDSLLPGGPRHTVDQAVQSYLKTGACHREDLAMVTNGGELSRLLTNGLLAAALDDAHIRELSLANLKESACTILGRSVSETEAKRLGGELLAIFDEMAKDPETREKAKVVDANSRRIYDDHQPDTVADDELEEQITRRDEYERCASDHEVFERFCKGKITTERARTRTVDTDLFGITGRDATEEEVKKLAALCPEEPLREWRKCTLAQQPRLHLEQSFSTMERNQRPMLMTIADFKKIIGRQASATDYRSSHAVLLTGRQKMNGQCGYWFRNSWGTQCPVAPKNTSAACDPARPGSIWISETQLLERGTGLLFSTEVTF